MTVINSDKNSTKLKKLLKSFFNARGLMLNLANSLVNVDLSSHIFLEMAICKGFDNLANFLAVKSGTAPLINSSIFVIPFGLVSGFSKFSNDDQICSDSFLAYTKNCDCLSKIAFCLDLFKKKTNEMVN